MSEWHNMLDDDFDIDVARKEVDICAGFDNWGNRYVTLTFEQIQKICEQIERESENER